MFIKQLTFFKKEKKKNNLNTKRKIFLLLSFLFFQIFNIPFSVHKYKTKQNKKNKKRSKHIFGKKRDES